MNLPATPIKPPAKPRLKQAVTPAKDKVHVKRAIKRTKTSPAATVAAVTAVNVSTLTPDPAIGKPVVAVFDFDGTLSDRHTFWRYLRFIATPLVFWPRVLPLLPSMAQVVIGKKPLMTARGGFIQRFLSNMPEHVEADYAQRFINGPLPTWIRPAALRRLRWHQAQGHLTVLVSNAPENYLLGWGASVGFDYVCGTRLEVKNGRLTGEVAGNDCVGEEKVRRLKEVVPDLDQVHVIAYGDSDGDQELLSVADSPFYQNWY